MDNPKIIVTIPMHESRRLPGKTTRLKILGKSALQHTIEYIYGMRYTAEIVVGSDSEAQLSAARELAVNAVKIKPSRSMLDAFSNLTLWQEQQLGIEFDFVLYLAPAPNRPEGIADRAIDEAIASGCDEVRSIVPIPKDLHPFIAYYRQDGQLTSMMPCTYIQSQHYPEVYALTGAVWVWPRETVRYYATLSHADQELWADGVCFPQKTLRGIVHALHEYHNIDTQEDFERAQQLLQKEINPKEI